MGTWSLHGIPRVIQRGGRRERRGQWRGGCNNNNEDDNDKEEEENYENNGYNDYKFNYPNDDVQFPSKLMHSDSSHIQDYANVD